MSRALSEPQEIAISGEPEGNDMQALLNLVRKGYRPFQVVALGTPHGQRPAVPPVQDRGPEDGQEAAEACRSLTCQIPASEPKALMSLLERGETKVTALLSAWSHPLERGSLIQGQAPTSHRYLLRLTCPS